MIASDVENKDLEFLTKLSHAVESHDTAKVHSMLGTSTSFESSLHTPLRNSSHRLSFMVAFLQGTSGTSNSTMGTTSVHKAHAYCAVLAVSCSFSAPWQAIDHFFADFDNLRSSEVDDETIFMSILIFLKKTVSAWGTSKSNATASSNKSPKYWILRISERIIQLILGESINRHRNSTGRTHTLDRILDTMKAFLSIGQMHDTSIVNSILNDLCAHTISPHSAAAWLSSFRALATFLRPVDVACMEDSLKRVFLKKKIMIPDSEWVQIIQDMLISVEHCCNDITLENRLKLLKDAQEVLFLVFNCLRVNPYLYSNVEGELQSWLSQTSSSILEGWVSSLSSNRAPDIPQWIWINMMVLTNQGVRDSPVQMATNVFAVTAANGVANENGVLRTFTETLVHCLTADASRNSPQNGKSYSDNHGVLVQDTVYVGRGKVKTNERRDNPGLTSIASKLNTSLLLGYKTLSVEAKRHGYTKRAMHWMLLLVDLTDRWRDTIPPQESLIVSMGFIILYMEAESLRPAVSLEIKTRIGGKSCCPKICTDIQRLHCATISCILHSIQQTTPPNTVNDGLSFLCTILTRKIPDDIFFALADCFVALPDTRQALFDFSRELLNNGGKNFSAILQGDQANDVCRHLRCAFFSFVLLLESEDWSDVEHRSCDIIWSALVLNEPPLPLVVRSWLYSLIRTRIKEAKILGLAAEYFLRTTIARLLLHYERDPNKEPRLQINRIISTHQGLDTQSVPRLYQYEALPELMHVIFDLLIYNACINADSYSLHQILTQQREVLLTQTLLSRDAAQSNATSDNDMMYSPRSEFAVNCGIFFEAMLLLLQHIVDELGRIPTWSKSKNGTDLLHGICLMFDEAVLSGLLEGSKPGAGSLWFGNKSQGQHAGSIGPGTLVSVGARDEMYLRLLDVLSELIFVPMPAATRQRSSFRSTIVALSHLVRLRQRVDSNIEECQYKETSFKAVGSLMFALSSVVSNELTSNGKSKLEDFDDMISVAIFSLQIVVNKSQAMKDIPDAAILNEVPLLYRALRKLYETICCEEASVQVVEFLESSLATKHGSSTRRIKQQRGPASLLSITSGTEVDATVQRLRLQVFGGIEECLRMEVSRHLLKQQMNVAGSCQRSGNDRISLGDLLKNLGTFSKDLRLGMSGCSGGLTLGIYKSVVSSIELTCELVSIHVGSTADTLSLQSICAVLSEAALCLRDVIFSFPQTQTEIFERSLILCMAKIPTVYFKVTRKCCGSRVDHLLSRQSKASDLAKAIEGETFLDCARILLTWSCLQDADHTPWEDIVGDADSSAAKENIDTTVAIGMRAKAGGNDEDNGNDDKTKIRFESKESWLSVFSALFGMHKHKWQQSMSILNETQCRSKFLGVDQQMFHYYRDKHDDLVNSIKHIALVLKPLHDNTSGPILETIVMSLPSAQKNDFLDLLENVLSVIIKAFGVLCDSIKVQSSTSQLCASQGALVEAVCCTQAWLSPQMECRHDFCALINTWHVRESRKKTFAGGNKKVPSVEIPQNLGKVSSQVNVLYSSLLSFKDLLTVPFSDTATLSYLHQLDMMINHESKTGDIHSLLGLANKKLQSIGDISMPNPARPLEEKFTKKQPPVLKRRRPRQRSAARSRNQIIDEWLQLDHDFSDTERVEDAFFELEDFIVDG